MRRINGDQLGDILDGQIRDRGLLKSFRGVRRNRAGRILLGTWLEQKARERNYTDVVAATEGDETDDQSFLERLLDFIRELTSPEMIEQLKAFLEMVLEFIKQISDLFGDT